MEEYSEDGYWKLVDGQWVASELQTQSLAAGANPYVPENNVAVNIENTGGLEPIHQVVNSATYQHKESNQKSRFGRTSVIFGTGTLVLIVTLIILFSTLSPGTVSLLDEMRDSDGDGIMDSDELEAGTNPELRDSDNDGLDDGEDFCPTGEVDWDSDIISDFDGDGCRDINEDLDDDNDGISDDVDRCDTSEVGWTSTPDSDNDLDGCHDDGDADDDNDGWSDTKESQCGTNHLRSTSKPADFDGDMICDIVDSDDDNDGVDDSQDVFPYDSSEWIDFDGDGIGDNSDTDDDNDGVLDIYDVNDYADTALKLTFDYFMVLTDMDYWDSKSETYICLYLEGENIGCKPNDEGSTWSMSTDTLYSLDSEFYFDLPENTSSHLVQICAWDEDAFDDDRIDINPNSANNCYNEYVDNTNSIGDSVTVTASGVGDGTGWDGELDFSYELIDFRNQLFTSFDWEYGSGSYSLDLSLDYDIYSYYKNLDHSVSGWEDYERFSTPDAQYVIELANELESMAEMYGYTSDLEEAEFILAFVRGIPYQYDIDGMGVSEYPKYPIEMLWEGAGDCEDAAALYISLMEALGYDTVLILLEVLQDEDDDTWGGHAMPGIHIPNHSGTYYYWTSGSKANIPYYLAEATGGSTSIGEDGWYDRQNAELYDVE
jgi:hypothetical protein